MNLIKLDLLKEYLLNNSDGGIALAYSGGVDSAFLLKVCLDLNINVTAVTFKTILHPTKEIDEATALASSIGANFDVIYLNELDNEYVLNNRKNRCYHCKKMLFTKLLEYAKEKNLAYIMDGTNFEDTFSYRPGLLALEELSVLSPLKQCGIYKNEVREYATYIGLNVKISKKPSTPCLATRFPYDELLTKEKLNMAFLAENILHDLGFSNLRVRLHMTIARIEVTTEYFADILAKREQIISKFKHIGIKYITLDLEGFRSGSMDI